LMMMMMLMVVVVVVMNTVNTRIWCKDISDL
jgi:hypothetical protein